MLGRSRDAACGEPLKVKSHDLQIEARAMKWDRAARWLERLRCTTRL
jgi:hypothetical protein